MLTIQVSPDDTWSCGDDLPYSRESNADGLREHYRSFSADGFTAHWCALVGRVGDGPYFLVGTSYRGEVVAAGQLILYNWDKYPVDNSGSITAAIAVGRGQR